MIHACLPICRPRAKRPVRTRSTLTARWLIPCWSHDRGRRRASDGAADELGVCRAVVGRVGIGLGEGADWDQPDRGTAALRRGTLRSAVAASDLPPPSPTRRELSDEAARDVLAALSGPYLPWGTSAMRPAGLVMVLNDIVLHGRRRVVELGSGISTVLLARLLCQRPPLGGFRVAAVEHDVRWVQWVTEQLDREGTGSDVVVVHAPLVPHPRAEPGLSWYDDAALSAGLRTALRGDPIDLLLVDGPPAYSAGHGLARYPALPVLRGWLAPDATVVLDDAERPGEQDVLRRWERETGFDFDRRAADRAGVAVASIAGVGPVTGPREG